VRVTEGSSSTQRVREAGHASHRRERLQQMEDEGVVPPRHRGSRGRRADVDPDFEHRPEQHEQEYMEDAVDVQLMEEQELVEELQAMYEDMEDAEPRRRQTKKKKKKVVDPEPLDDYPGGPYDTSLLWRYQVHVARKAAYSEVFINVKLTLICC